MPFPESINIRHLLSGLKWPRAEHHDDDTLVMRKILLHLVVWKKQSK